MPGEGPLQAALMSVHVELDALFLVHQRALLDRDVARARSAFARFRDVLLRHAADEEAIVLPLYAACGGDATDSPAAQFRLEHDKLRRFLDELGPRLDALAQPIDDRELLAILDRESWFKNLLLHHDLRERNALYPRLSSLCDEAAQRAALAQLAPR